jgi:hypothetical protein
MPTPLATRNDQGRPSERADAPQRSSVVAAQVWRRAQELVDPLAHHDLVALALNLLRTAHHDPAAMADALALGRQHVRSHPDDTTASGGVEVLERGMAFLGMKSASLDEARHRALTVGQVPF